MSGQEPPELPIDNGLKTRKSFFSRKDGKPKYDESFSKAVFKSFFYQIWTAGLLKLLSGKFQSSIMPFKTVHYVYLVLFTMLKFLF